MGSAARQNGSPSNFTYGDGAGWELSGQPLVFPALLLIVALRGCVRLAQVHTIPDR
jgi:hypothetical protein